MNEVSTNILKKNIGKTKDMHVLSVEKEPDDISNYSTSNLLSMGIESKLGKDVRVMSFKLPYPPTYFVFIEKTETPIFNLIIRGGGDIENIKPLKMPFEKEKFNKMKNIASVLIKEKESLELLLFLESEGPSTTSDLVREVVSENRLLRVISELSRCGLVSVCDNVVSLSASANYILNKLLMIASKEHS